MLCKPQDSLNPWITLWGRVIPCHAAPAFSVRPIRSEKAESCYLIEHTDRLRSALRPDPESPAQGLATDIFDQAGLASKSQSVQKTDDADADQRSQSQRSGDSIPAHHAAASELLQTRLTLPVNANTFNTFNEYTSLLEVPHVNGEVDATVGDFGFGES